MGNGTANTTNAALIVDDHTPIRKAVKAVMSRMEFGKIVESYNADSAIVALHENYFDIVILDLKLGYSSGFQVLEHIRNQDIGSDIPILIVTGETDKDDIMKSVDLGANDYLIKPFQTEDLEKKVNHLLDLHHNPNEATRLIRSAENFLRKNRAAEALSYVDQSLELDPDNMRARHLKAVCLKSAGQTKEALDLLNENIKIKPQYFKNFRTKCDILLESGREDAALESLRSELELHPKIAPRQALIGELLIKVEKYEDAINHLRESLKENPRYERALLSMVEAFASTKNVEKCLYYCKRVRRYHPKNTRCLELVVKYALKFGEPRKAEIILRDEKHAHPERPDVFIILARFYESQSERERALEVTDELITRHPKFPGGYRLKGELLLAAKKRTEAIVVFKNGYRKTSAPGFLTRLGETYLSVKNYDTAVAMLHRAIRKSKKPENFELLMQAYCENKEWAKGYLLLKKHPVGFFKDAAKLHNQFRSELANRRKIASKKAS